MASLSALNLTILDAIFRPRVVARQRVAFDSVGKEMDKVILGGLGIPVEGGKPTARELRLASTALRDPARFKAAFQAFENSQVKKEAGRHGFPTGFSFWAPF